MLGHRSANRCRFSFLCPYILLEQFCVWNWYFPLWYSSSIWGIETYWIAGIVCPLTGRLTLVEFILQHTMTAVMTLPYLTIQHIRDTLSAILTLIWKQTCWAPRIDFTLAPTVSLANARTVSVHRLFFWLIPAGTNTGIPIDDPNAVHSTVVNGWSWYGAKFKLRILNSIQNETQYSLLVDLGYAEFFMLTPLLISSRRVMIRSRVDYWQDISKRNFLPTSWSNADPVMTAR